MDGDGMIGRSVLRTEDVRLLTGQGRFADDISLPGMAWAAMVRSPHAHARIRSIDKTAALAMPGVIEVLTGADALADGLQRIPHNPTHSSPPDIILVNRDGSDIYIPHHHILPADKARYVGEAVAVVIAGTRNQAIDAAEEVAVDWEVLPAAVDTWQSAGPGAPKVWDEGPGNVCIDAAVGDEATVEAAFAKAHTVAKFRTTVARLAGVPMEPRAAVAAWDDDGNLTVWHGIGGVVRHKKELAHILGIEEERVRVVAGDVGGNFGTRNPMYVEGPVVAWAARRLGRPVKWRGDRTEIFLTDCQARDLAAEAEMAFDAEGAILAMRSLNIGSLGAHTISFVPVTKGVEILCLAYRIPHMWVRAQAVHSNTPPTYPYRAAGRPEVHWITERLIEIGARQLGMDRAAIRQKNLIRPDEFPHDNRLGLTYDCGDFPTNMALALQDADWAGFEARRAEAAKRGRLRGIGVSTYIDLSTGFPFERSDVTVKPEGEIEVVIGTGDSGQGHYTSFAQIAADVTETPFDCIRVVQGDTARVKVGGGSHSGRSMRMGAIVITQAWDVIVEKARRIAAIALEAAEGDIEYANARFTVAGTDRAIDLFEVARRAEAGDGLPEDLRGPLRDEAQVEFRKAVIGNGAQVVEVEVDPETGVVTFPQYCAVDDVGRAINPQLIDGQTHGGIAQGVGQAIFEACAYDPESGQMRAATFMDYAMPRADNLPSFTTRITESPSPTNRLGIKAGSEGGTPPAPPAVVNAILDALHALGVKQIELPATPLAVWQAIRATQTK
jgi:carbon-monoxide dehydrogenase large subunit